MAPVADSLDSLPGQRVVSEVGLTEDSASWVPVVTGALLVLRKLVSYSTSNLVSN